MKVLFEEVTINSIIEPPSRQPTDWRTITPKKFPKCCKSYRAHNIFPSLETQQGTEWDLKASRIWLQNSHRIGETGFWRDKKTKNKKHLCATVPRKKEQWPHKRLSQTCLWMSRNLPWRHRSTVACHEVRALTTTVMGAEVCWHKSFWRTLSSLLSLSLPYLASVQTMRRNHSPTHQQKFELKIYWAWPCPPEQDSVFPTASPFHQEASSGLLFSSIRGQTEWKAQSQKTNQTDYMNPSLV